MLSLINLAKVFKIQKVQREVAKKTSSWFSRFHIKHVAREKKLQKSISGQPRTVLTKCGLPNYPCSPPWVKQAAVRTEPCVGMSRPWRTWPHAYLSETAPHFSQSGLQLRNPVEVEITNNFSKLFLEVLITNQICFSQTNATSFF